MFIGFRQDQVGWSCCPINLRHGMERGKPGGDLTECQRARTDMIARGMRLDDGMVNPANANSRPDSDVQFLMSLTVSMRVESVPIETLPRASTKKFSDSLEGVFLGWFAARSAQRVAAKELLARAPTTVRACGYRSSGRCGTGVSNFVNESTGSAAKSEVPVCSRLTFW